MITKSTDEARSMDYKARLDLYDRRWEVYAATERFLVQVLGTLNPETNDIAELRRSTVHARFLFGSDVNDYLRDLIVHAIALRKWTGIYKHYRTNPAAEKKLDEARKGMADETDWFAKQPDTLIGRFMRYMDLSTVGTSAESVDATDTTGK